MITIFMRLIEEHGDKEYALRAAVRSVANGKSDQVFEVDVSAFRQLPGSAMAYWATSGVMELFARHEEFDNESVGRATRCGLGSLDDFRFIRAGWEVARGDDTWRVYYHGGVYSSFYDQFPLVVLWAARGRELKCYVEQKVGSVSRKVQGEDHYFEPGFVFPRRTRALAPKVMPAGGIFSTAGQAGFAPMDVLLASIGLLSSSIVSYLISLGQGRTRGYGQFEVGLIKRVPWPRMGDKQTILGELARRSWSLKRDVDAANETSHAFLVPGLLLADGDSLATRCQTWMSTVRSIEAELSDMQADIDEIGFQLYGLDRRDRARVESDLRSAMSATDGGLIESESTIASMDADYIDDSVSSLLAWAVGVAFGRFDIRLAAGGRSATPEPNPFDQLPVNSPGMLVAGNALPAEVVPVGYPLAFPRDGIMVDDLGGAHDLLGSCRHVFDLVFDDPATRWEEAAEMLNDGASSLRSWFGNRLFDKHIKCYSTSRRKAPIYWQLGTPSASFSAWIYYHRFTRDTMFRLLNDHIVPKLQHEERKLTAVIQDAGPSPSSSQRRAVDVQSTFVSELRAFRDEVARVAPLWNPDLNDGAILNFAPVWRLVPQHQSWQKECKAAWFKLCAGEFDWAHLAMHLWPERVVPKCAKDRSLAIAHGLEGVFWHEGAGGKWQGNPVSADEVQRLVRERTSAAVKDALKNLSEAPAPAGGPNRRAQRNMPSQRAETRGPARDVSLPGERIKRATSVSSADSAIPDLIRGSIAELGGESSKAEILAVTGLSDGVWVSAIKALLADGSVIKTGERRGTRYHLAGGVS